MLLNGVERYCIILNAIKIIQVLYPFFFILQLLDICKVHTFLCTSLYLTLYTLFYRLTRVSVEVRNDRKTYQNEYNFT